MIKQFWRRGISSLLSVVMLLGALQLPVAAEKGYVKLPEMEIEQDILENNLFYIPTNSAVVEESERDICLLRVARGGDCNEEAGVTVKIADFTAKLGKDYEIRVHNEDTKIDNPKDNLSLLEQMEGSEYTQNERKSEEETLEEIENNSEMADVSQQAQQAAVNFVLEASGVGAQLKEQNDDTESAQTDSSGAEIGNAGSEQENTEDGTATDGNGENELQYSENGEVISTNPIQRAKQVYTGIDAEPQRVTSTTDMMQQVQDMANVMTNAVVGASVTLEFAPGEREKFIEIETVDNSDGDGERYFYIMLGAPWGSCTNSAASSTAITVLDDEEAEPSVVFFSEDSYKEEDGVVTVEVCREGALNSIAEVTLTTNSVTATEGRDFSPVDRHLVFPMGIDRQTVEIPVETKYFNGEKQFSLNLEAGNGSEVEENTATVTLQGTYSALQTPSVQSSVSGNASTARLSDIRLGEPIDLSKPLYKGNDDNKFGGSNKYDSGKSAWFMQWRDNSIFYNRKGKVGAVWRLTSFSSDDEEGVAGYEYAGAQISWKRDGSDATMSVQIKTSEWAWDAPYIIEDIASKFGVSEPIPFNYSSDKDFKHKTDQNIFSTTADTRIINIYNTAKCDDCTKLWIESITPIMRPFKITLKSANKLSFLQADGTYKEDDGTATVAALNGASNDSNASVVLYAGDTVTVKQPTGSNVTNYATMEKLYMVNGKKKKAIATGAADASSTLSYTIPTGDAMLADSSYMTFPENDYMVNEDSVGSDEKTKGLYGNIELQPEFSYKNAYVTVKAPEGGDVNAGYLNISGQAYDLKGEKSIVLPDTYHLGDILQVSTTMYDEYKDEYVPTGFKLRYKVSRSDRSTQEVNVIYKDESSIISDGRLRYEEIEIIPLFERKNNSIKVRVAAEDVEKFDTSFGIFKTGRTETSFGGKRYYDYTLANTDQTVYGKQYVIPIQMKDDTYTPIWQENGENTQYCGETLYYTAKDSAAKNIIYLSAQQTEEWYLLKGQLYYMSYNLTTNRSGTAAALPAENAAVSAPGGGAMVDKNGDFKTSRFRGVNGCTLRYMVSVNGKDEIRETVLNTNNPDSDNDPITYVNTIQQTMQSQVSPVNSEIFQNGNVTLESSNEMGGQVIPIIADDFATMLIEVGVTEYTQKALDSNNNWIETPNQKETATAAQLVIYDEKNQVVATLDAKKDDGKSSSANIVFDATIPFGADAETGEKLNITPGDRIFLRLTTDRARTLYNGGTADVGYTYTDVFTGYIFTSSTTFEDPVAQQLDVPLDVNFTELPLLGDVGMDFNFPFVSMGVMRLDQGYRMYIGVSVGSITDLLAEQHMRYYADDTGDYYGDLFKVDEPIKSFANGLKTAYEDAFKVIPRWNSSAAGLGAPTWRFDVQVGVYFDFIYADVQNTSTGVSSKVCAFSGVGAYVGAQVGFKKAWYTILPAVFIPAYIGLKVEASALGFLGAERDPSKPGITYDAAQSETVDFINSSKNLNGSVKLGGMFQLYAGVGLADTIGVRIDGTVDAMGVYEPSDLVNDMGGSVSFSAGLNIDLFLFSVPLRYEFANLKFGSFEKYAEGVGNNTISPQADDAAAQPTFRLRQGSDTESVWMPNSGMSPRGGFAVSGTAGLEENAYERPDSQLIALPNGGLLLAYLANTPDKGALERTTLKVAVFKNGRWSNSVTVQDDGTADFQPSVCVAGDKVMIAWVSSEPNTHTTEDAVDYLRYLDVYTAMIDPNTLEVSELERMSTEDTPYYDYDPVCVYDDITGDRMVYYTKADVWGTIENVINSYTNDCAVIYRIYDADGGGWLETYFDSELSAEVQQEMLPWKGQRFLSSPISGINNPAIADFTASGYNGLAVYAYTIDMDSTNDTDYDKELFVQVYDFTTHKTYRPIRITNDTVSDSLPQLIRTGTGETASTKLFWYHDGKEVQYLDLSMLVKEGISDNGMFKEVVNDSGETVTYEPKVQTVSPRMESSMDSTAMADFRVTEDANGNIYVIWTQPDVDENGDACQEIYATALIGDSDASEDESYNPGINWANPYRLTYSGRYNDEPAVAIDGEGNMMVVHNQYVQTLTGQEDNPLEISDMTLMASYMEPCGTMDVSDVVFSDETPMLGEEVNVTVRLENNGLTKANGYTMKVFAVSAKGETEVYSVSSDNVIIPANGATEEFTWTVPDTVDGTYLRIEVQEGSYSDTSVYETEPLEEKPIYTISNISSYLATDGIHVTYSVSNTGNSSADNGEKFSLTLSGPYGAAREYQENERALYNGELGSVNVDEMKTFDAVINTMPKMFERFGFLTALAVCSDADGNRISNAESVAISLKEPLALTINDGNGIDIEAGTTQQLTAVLSPAELFDDAEIIYSVADSSVARVEGDTLIGVSDGQTTVYAAAVPYGTATELAVTVKSDNGYVSSGSGGGGGTSFYTVIFDTMGGSEIDSTRVGVQGTVKEPSAPVRDGYTFDGWYADKEYTAPYDFSTKVTKSFTLYAKWTEAFSDSEAWDNPYVDVKETDWFYEDVRYVYVNKLFEGISNEEFGPNIPMTRAMLVTVLYRAEGQPSVENENSDHQFADVDADSWYGDAVYWAWLHGIVKGYSDEEFAPNQEISREQIAAIFERYAEYKGIATDEKGDLSKFTDADKISDWAKDNVRWAVGAGLISGRDDGTIDPLGNATRAEIAAIMHRYLTKNN